MPTALLLYKLPDLDLSNVEATPHVELRIASLLLPPTLEDVHPQAQSPGTYPPGRIPSRELTTLKPISIYNLFDSYIDVLASTTPTTQNYKVPYFYLTSLRLRDLSGPPRNPLKGHHLFTPATTRSFLSSVAVPVAPFKLQPAPSMLQHKPSYTKPYLKTSSDPGLTENSGGLEGEDCCDLEHKYGRQGIITHHYLSSNVHWKDLLQVPNQQRSSGPSEERE
ncbi:hypothetical protein GG344DRAFT_84154 [Lentinula edodes]|nr:hypothetical protein GG344DRAFT_84154 [Lentinula edodes]